MTLWYSSIGIFILDFLFGFSFCFSSMFSLRHDSCIFRLTRAWNMEDMSWFAFAGAKFSCPEQIGFQRVSERQTSTSGIFRFCPGPQSVTERKEPDL